MTSTFLYLKDILESNVYEQALASVVVCTVSCARWQRKGKNTSSLAKGSVSWSFRGRRQNKLAPRVRLYQRAGFKTHLNPVPEVLSASLVPK